MVVFAFPVFPYLEDDAVAFGNFFWPISAV